MAQHRAHPVRVPCDSFQLVMPPGIFDWGIRQIGVRRHRRRPVPRATVRIPTVLVSLNDWKWLPLRGPSGLKSEAGEFTDTMGFLEAQLAQHQTITREGQRPQV
jgi:hypothetical protein